ncbi:ATP-binding protein [Methanocaldococcus sp. 10A]
MAIADEILNLISSGVTKWDDILDALVPQYDKPSITMARKRLIDRGIIEMYEKDGEKYLRFKETNENNNVQTFNQETFRLEHEGKIKQYIKSKLSESHHWNTFDIKEYTYLTMDLEFNDDVIEHPFKVREILSQIYKDCYEEIYGELPDKEIQIVNPRTEHLRISQISSNHVGKLITFEGMIIQASKVKSRCVRATFQCSRCGEIKSRHIGIWDNIKQVAKSLTCDNCRKAEAKYEFEFVEELSIYANFQELLIQEPIELCKDGRQHSISVFLENHEGVYSGKVRITGVPIRKPNKKSSVSDIHIYALGIEILDDIEIKITDEDIEQIKKVVKDKKAIDKISNYMFREIKGYEIVKKAIFLQQIKGVRVDELGIRGDFHILLITDPGVGKSTMMRKLEKFGAVYTSAVGSSDVGLTASIVKESTEFMDSYVIKPGALVLADGGTCCIDEISHNSEIYKALLNPMEQQRVDVSKAGIKASLPARCAILAACNPKWGRFNKDLTVAEQINIPAPLLSRFDLIFPLMDIPEKTKDDAIYRHSIRKKREFLKNKEDKLIINGVEITDDFILKYIHYARQLKPVISEEAEDVLTKYYVELRVTAYEKCGTVPITMRQGEALQRIAEAIAKAKLKEQVDAEDAKEAIEIMDYCLKQIAYDIESESIDIDKIAGTPKSRRDKEQLILNIVKELSEDNEDNLAIECDIIEKAKQYGLKEEDVEEILQRLKKIGELYQPRYGYWQII